MRKLLPILLLTAAMAMSGDMTMTVAEMIQFIQSSVKMRYPDKQVAEYLHHVKLTNRLDDRTIESLEGMGAGPKTVAALHDLRDSSARLAAPPPPAPKAAPRAPAPPPNSIEQAKIIDGAREYALNYTKQLPNYLCIQVTRRYLDPTSTARNDNDPDWRLMDTVMTRLTYFEQREDYKVVMVNNHAVNDISMERLGGTVSLGEFGSLMKDIFDRTSEAHFDWDHWATLRGHRMYVFAYDVDQAHSRYHISWERSLDLIPAYKGLIYVDKDTNMIMRITQEPYGIPTTFPIHWVKTILDFDFTKIGESEYLVPLKAVVTSQTSRYAAKNEIEFRLYQKFGTETTIKFTDVPPPLPEEKTKEKP